MPEVQVAHFVNMVQLNGRYAAALHLIQRFRTKAPDAKISMVVQELQVLKAAERFPEV